MDASPVDSSAMGKTLGEHVGAPARSRSHDEAEGNLAHTDGNLAGTPATIGHLIEGRGNDWHPSETAALT